MDYKATDTEFQTVANAIRTKGGTQAQLEWPTGFVNAIASIPSSVNEEWNEPIIRNWDFTNPINTRGQSHYPNSSLTINGWKTSTQTECSIVQGGIYVEHLQGSEVNTNLYNQVFFPIAEFSGLQFTASMLANNKFNSVTFTLYDSGQRLVEVLIDNCTFWVNRDSSLQLACGFSIPAEISGDSILIQAIKLELGNKQTLAKQENGIWTLRKHREDIEHYFIGRCCVND